MKKKYKKFIETEENNNSNLLIKINELNNKEKTDMEYLENKLNLFRDEQMKLNQENNQKIELLNKRLNENDNQNQNNTDTKQNLEMGNIYNNNSNIRNNNEIENKINNLENKINILKETAEKLDKIKDKNQEEVNQKFEEINNWLGNFSQNVNNNLKNMKLYIEKKFQNLNQSNNEQK